MTLLSIIIPNYNYGHYAERLFNSLMEQSMPLDDVEIIFVDDGSTDQSLEKARHWSAAINCRKFEILTPMHSGKPGMVRNAGLERAQGEYLMSLDPDDTLKPGYLSACMEIFEDDSSAGLVFTDYIERSSIGERIVSLPDFHPSYLRTQNPISPTAIYKRQFFDRGARYRSNIMYEDWDYWIQMLMLGASFRHIPTALYNYEIHDNNFSLKAVRDDGPSKARIVLNNEEFFHPVVRDWAKDHLRNRIHAPAFPRGLIPRPEDIRKLLLKIDKGDLE